MAHILRWLVILQIITTNYRVIKCNTPLEELYWLKDNRDCVYSYLFHFRTNFYPPTFFLRPTTCFRDGLHLYTRNDNFDLFGMQNGDYYNSPCSTYRSNYRMTPLIFCSYSLLKFSAGKIWNSLPAIKFESFYCSSGIFLLLLPMS